MKPYCEFITQQILPSLRAIIARNLIEKYNMTQEEVARRLSVTQGAVSQYLRQIRGGKKLEILEDDDIKNLIENLCNSIVNGPNNLDVTKKICEVCKTLREKKLI